MKRGLALICVLSLLTAALTGTGGCALRQKVPPTVPPETELTTPSPAPTLPPTPSLTSVPGVDAQWYIERNNTLRDMMAKNGEYSGTKEIDRAIEKMYIDPDKPMVALTFDDGPKPGVTDEILDILKNTTSALRFLSSASACTSRRNWHSSNAPSALAAKLATTPGRTTA